MKQSLKIKITASAALIIALVICNGFAHAQETRKVDSLESVARSMPDDSSKIEVMRKIATAYESIDPGKTLLYARSIGTLSQKLNFKKGLGHAYLLVGIYYAITGKLETAIDSIKEAEKIYSSIHALKQLQSVYSSLSNVYGQQGKYGDALSYALKDLEVSEQRKDTIYITDSHISIGIIYNSLHKFDEARKNFFIALDLSKKVNYRAAEARAYNNIGSSYSYENHYDEAVSYYEKALVIKREMGDKAGEERALNNIGGDYIKLGQKSKALNYLHQALALAQSMSDSAEIANCSGNLGIAFTDFKDYDSAAFYLSRTFEISDRIGEKESASNALAALSDLFEAKGDYKTSLDYYKQYKGAQDSLLSADEKKNIAQIQTKYESDKKDQQIAFLNTQDQLKNQQLKLQRLELYSAIGAVVLLLLIGSIIVINVQRKRKLDSQIALLEKQNEIESVRNKISLDIHDEIGSGLTKINLLLGQFNSEKKSETEKKELAERISSKSREVISGLGEIVWTANPVHDNLTSMLGFMHQFISKFFEDTGIHYVINFPEQFADQEIHPELKRNLFLVLKESLNNVLKHSGATEVVIAFHQKGNSFGMEVTDNGRGIDESASSLFGNGLKGMKKRIDEVKGNFTLHSGPGKGTGILIEGFLY